MKQKFPSILIHFSLSLSLSPTCHTCIANIVSSDIKVHICAAKNTLTVKAHFPIELFKWRRSTRKHWLTCVLCMPIRDVASTKRNGKLHALDPSPNGSNEFLWLQFLSVNASLRWCICGGRRACHMSHTTIEHAIDVATNSVFVSAFYRPYCGHDSRTPRRQKQLHLKLEWSEFRRPFISLSKFKLIRWQ